MRPGTGPVRLLAVIEAATVTGPAKNLIEFYRTVRSWDAVELSIATFVRGDRASDFIDAVMAEGVSIICIPERGAFDPSVPGRLRSAVHSSQAQVIQTHAIKSHFLAYVSNIWKAMPWIAFHHGYTTTDAKMLLYNQLDRVSLRASKRVVTVSRAFERQLVDRGLNPSKITVLHNAVDPKWAMKVCAMDRTAVRRELGFQPGERILVAIGRMSREKGHTDLLAAFHRLRQRIPHARLVLVGDGPERGRLQEIAGEAVLFTGQVRDATPYYAAADVMVLPSLTEGSPNVLLEAMAAGIPVVATAVGGTPEIATDGEDALLVPPRRPDALEAAIERVLESPQLCSQLVANARATVEQNHLPEKRARVLVDMYQAVRSATML